MSLLLNMLSRFVMAFLPRRKHLLISWLQSPSAVVLEPKKIKFVTVSIVSPSIYGPEWRKKRTQEGKNSLLFLIIQDSASVWSQWPSLCCPSTPSTTAEGNGNPLQYSCLGNPMDRGAWRATVRGVTKSWTWMNTRACTHTRAHTHTHTLQYCTALSPLQALSYSQWTHSLI